MSDAQNQNMRIDSSGNLLVGKTTISLDTNGFEARTEGTTIATTNGSPSLYVNRRTSDGTIIDIRKTALQSSIGSEGGDSLFIGSGDTDSLFL